MRVSTSQIQSSATNTILDQQAELLRTQNQLGTGRRIQTPSDDPSGAARALDLDKAVKSTEQFQRNNEQAELRLRQEDSVLDQVNNVTTRIRELTLQAANASQNGSSRDAIASELRERRDELQQLANTRDGRGEFLFSGNATETEPFVQQDGRVVYEGDQGQRNIQVGPNRQVDSSHNGFETFMKIPTGNGDFQVRPDDSNQGTARLASERVNDAGADFRGPYDVTFQDNPATGTLETRVIADADAFVDDNGDTLETSATTDGVLDGLDTGASPFTGTVGLDLGGGDVRTLTLEEADGIDDINDLQAAVEDFIDDEAINAAIDGDLAVGVGPGGDELVFDYDGNNPIRGSIALEDQDGGEATADVALGTLIEADTFRSGEAIDFDGRSVTFDGQPEAGDAFTVERANNRSVFDTVDGIIDALETRGDTSRSRALLATEVYEGLEGLDRAGERFSEIRAETGARLNALESEFDANEVARLDLETELSRVEDLDFAEAISRLQQQSVGLEAAQRSFAQIQNLSLFDFI